MRPRPAFGTRLTLVGVRRQRLAHLFSGAQVCSRLPSKRRQARGRRASGLTSVLARRVELAPRHPTCARRNKSSLRPRPTWPSSAFWWRRTSMPSSGSVGAPIDPPRLANSIDQALLDDCRVSGGSQLIHTVRRPDVSRPNISCAPPTRRSVLREPLCSRGLRSRDLGFRELGARQIIHWRSVRLERGSG